MLNSESLIILLFFPEEKSVNQVYITKLGTISVEIKKKLSSFKKI